MKGIAQERPPAAVRQGESLTGRSFGFLNGTFDLKVSGADTGGGLCVYDTARSEPGGPPMHVHAAQDEWFLVTEGAFDIRVGDITHHLGPGDSVLGPRGVPHAFRNTSRTGRILVVFQPAGTMEAFFDQGSALGPLTPAAFAELSSRHGMTVVGPPLT
ncbi:cupin domain-containing protein [Rhodobacter sp. Har01]|uniref:cupin domain-containing protein n=1 Tax=Rhodobacter sp. Har01 TaxID=2883999 RepID=UPI001D07A7D8|nr:cupin domain-containing protein [Rhodobacter sp. Har01]MCB6179124.1 cupin domain-containing protein [Rhodobacter sp. Har01]